MGYYKEQNQLELDSLTESVLSGLARSGRYLMCGGRRTGAFVCRRYTAGRNDANFPTVEITGLVLDFFADLDHPHMIVVDGVPTGVLVRLDGYAKPTLIFKSRGRPIRHRAPRVFYDWTDARVKTLEDLWKLGVRSSAIAEILGGGITKNAVIAKARSRMLGPHPRHRFDSQDMYDYLAKINHVPKRKKAA